DVLLGRRLGERAPPLGVERGRAGPGGAEEREQNGQGGGHGAGGTGTKGGTLHATRSSVKTMCVQTLGALVTRDAPRVIVGVVEWARWSVSVFVRCAALGWRVGPTSLVRTRLIGDPTRSARRGHHERSLHWASLALLPNRRARSGPHRDRRRSRQPRAPRPEAVGRARVPGEGARVRRA